jgi:hypothetical protein
MRFFLANTKQGKDWVAIALLNFVIQKIRKSKKIEAF